jgi:hypothetical protein
MATVLTNIGKALAATRMKGGSAEPVHLGWGTGPGVADVSDNALFTEAPEARVAGVSSLQTTNVPNDTYQVTATLTATAPRTITNAGLFDAPVGGSLFVHGDFPGVTLQPGDQIQFTVRVTFT